MTRSVVLRGASFVVVQDFELKGAEQGLASLASSQSGTREVVVQRNRIHDTREGLSPAVRELLAVLSSIHY